MDKILSHYTQFHVLVDILHKKHIVFGNPCNWEDKTDYKILREYAEELGLGDEDIRALCFTELPKKLYDSILHWKIYAPGKAGCRIDFDKNILKNVIEQHGLELKKMDYLNTEDLEKHPEKWHGKPPFLKRSPYNYEHEWRVLRLGKLKKDDVFELNIENVFSKIIKCVKLSPDMPRKLAKNLRDFINDYGIKAEHSWICENPEWERIVKKSLTRTSNHRSKT
ncbi:MAG: DUF2971 domain-containing protein [Fibromonadaceae bacterium]|jgi:hypothetical protein|nr:DUF2971 domain-containing protein [Fibromonadaceae bacterium]